ncbi:MAG: N-acetyltransferase [Pseudomonadota bacterium]
MQFEETVRETGADDLDRILALYPVVFPDEELRPLVADLLGGDAAIVSLAAFTSDTVIAHVAFTLFKDARNVSGALLGPLGVLPDHQRRGVGTRLVNDGVARLDALGVSQIFVLGDPSYYRRFRFGAEDRVLPPYALPTEWSGAWQSRTLSDRAPLTAGRCTLPSAWMNAALWVP